MDPRNSLDLRFFRYLARPPERLSLAEGCLLVASQEYPDLDPRPWIDRLSELGARVRRRTGVTLPQARAALRDLLFREEGFRGNREDYEDPRNSYLPDVLERRLGIPISLSAVYLEAAWRAGFGPLGVNFPGRFLVRWPEPGGGGPIVDPFGGGAEPDARELQALLDLSTGGGVALDPRRDLIPAGVREILDRMLGNLQRLHAEGGRWERALWCLDWREALKPDRPEHRRDRGFLLLAAGRRREGLELLEGYLQEEGFAPDAAWVWHAVQAAKLRDEFRFN